MVVEDEGASFFILLEEDPCHLFTQLSEARVLMMITFAEQQCSPAK